MKQLKLRTFIRTAPREVINELKEKAKRAISNPETIFPVCKHESAKCILEKSRREVRALAKFADDEFKLKGYLKSLFGDPIAKGYACLLLLQFKEELPPLIPMKTPFGLVTFVYSGSVPKEIVAGLQHYDDEFLRLMTYIHLGKRGLHIYSSKNSFICTGFEAAPPTETVNEIIMNLDYSLKKINEKKYSCEHSKGNKLRIHWKSANCTLTICEKCSHEDSNLYFEIANHIIDKNLDTDFDISFKYEVHCNAKCSKCISNLGYKPEVQTIKNYLTGKLFDKKFIQDETKLFKEYVRSLPDIYYVTGYECFGSNVDMFLDALKCEPYEKRALKKLFSRTKESYIDEESQISKIFLTYWAEHGKTLLREFCTDDKKIEELDEKVTSLLLTPSRAIAESLEFMKMKNTLSRLPDYEKLTVKLPDIARFIDRVTRMYLVEQFENILKILDKEHITDTKKKSIVCAFLIIADKLKNNEWRFTKDELDFGMFLSKFAKELLSAEGQNYHDALRVFYEISGGSEKFPLL